MGNENTSGIVQALGMETNQGESARSVRPPIVRCSIGDEDTGFCCDNRKPGGAVRNVVTEAPHSVSSQIQQAGRGLPNLEPSEPP